MSDRVLQFVAERSTALKAVLLALMAAIAFCSTRPGSRWFSAAWRGLGLIAQKRGLSVALVGLVALLSSMGVSLLVRIPEPRIHDEFSYLLAADTFARGRLTNPTHPLWVHFESFHINQQPTYQSKYPPAQGLILAAGQVIGGHPVLGLWISIALACAAICWMLQAWLPSRWALLGGFLAVLHPGILLRWGQTYWGGAMAVIGGALVFGALRRIVRRPRVHDALLMGAGLAILANSRPYEGMIACLPVAVALMVWMVGKNGPAARVSIRRIVLPTLVVLALTGAAMGYYNLRGTGHPLIMPYQVHEITYFRTPFFVFRDNGRPEPTYRHEVMRDYYAPDRERKTHRQKIVPDLYDKVPIVGTALRRTHELSRPVMKRAKRLWKVYLGFALTIPLFMLPWVMRDKWMRFALLTCGVLIAIVVSRLLNPHYAAPITGLVFALVLQGMRHMRILQWHGRPTGRLIVQAILVICVASLVLSLAQKIRVKPSHAWSLQRPRILAELKKDGERHLVIVRYPPKYSWTTGEWMYNEADIDGAKVVWAREMDADQNLRLLEYFNDRQVWLLEVGQNRPPFKLVPYPGRISP